MNAPLALLIPPPLTIGVVVGLEALIVAGLLFLGTGTIRRRWPRRAGLARPVAWLSGIVGAVLVLGAVFADTTPQSDLAEPDPRHGDLRHRRPDALPRELRRVPRRGRPRRRPAGRDDADPSALARVGAPEPAHRRRHLLLDQHRACPAACPHGTRPCRRPIAGTSSTTSAVINGRGPAAPPPSGLPSPVGERVGRHVGDGRECRSGRAALPGRARRPVRRMVRGRREEASHVAAGTAGG